MLLLLTVGNEADGLQWYCKYFFGHVLWQSVIWFKSWTRSHTHKHRHT